MEYLAHARVPRLGEKSRKALLLSLTRCLDERFWPLGERWSRPGEQGLLKRECEAWDVTDYVRIWKLHRALWCVIRSMVSARTLSVVADRCGSKAP